MIWLYYLSHIPSLVRSDSALGVDLTEIQIQTSDFTRWKPAVPTDATKLARLNRAIDSGLRSVYFPDLVLGERFAYAWSFLRPVMKFDVFAGLGDYILPADVGGIEGEITFVATQSCGTILMRGEQWIRKARQSATGDGVPRYGAVTSIRHDGGLQQRLMLMLWPTPAGTHSLTARYYMNASALTSANPYPPGGPALAEVILQACRAAADRMFNSRVADEQRLFVERLRSAIEHDRRRTAPEHLGRMRDPGMASASEPGGLMVRFTNEIPTLEVAGIQLS